MANAVVPTIKIVLVGDGASGKSCMVQSYLNDSFHMEYIPTVFDNYKATIRVQDQTLNLSLWDTAGQEEYNLLRPLSYQQADIFLICFSVMDRNSFRNATKRWFSELEKQSPKIPKMFVGTKIDLRINESSANHLRARMSMAPPLMVEEIEKAISEMKADYLECSALTQEGLKDVFDESIKILLRNKRMLESSKKGKKKDDCNMF